MIYRIAKGNKLTFATADGFNNFPKVVFTSPTTMEIVTTSDEFSSLEVGSSTLTYEPSATPSVTVDEEDYELELGADFDTMILTTYTDGNLVLKKLIGAPDLSLELDENDNPSLEWTNTFSVKTKIYRTAIYPAGDDAPDEFVLVAEINGPAIPGDEGVYLDTAIELVSEEEDDFAISYFVVNENGVSTIKEVSTGLGGGIGAN